MRVTSFSMLLLVASACGEGESAVDGGASSDAATFDAATSDGGSDAATTDAGTIDAATTDAGTIDAGPTDAGPTDAGTDAGTGLDAGSDAGRSPDAGVTRAVLVPGFCPSTSTAPGFYRGTLASNLNDVGGAPACGVSSAPGRDGAVRVELLPGQTVTATYRHAGDGILYLLDSCPVTSSCLAGSDSSSSGPESLTWTNEGSTTNPVTLILDSDSLDGPQTFELDLVVTGS